MNIDKKLLVTIGKDIEIEFSKDTIDRFEVGDSWMGKYDNGSFSRIEIFYKNESENKVFFSCNCVKNRDSRNFRKVLIENKYYCFDSNVNKITLLTSNECLHQVEPSCVP